MNEAASHAHIHNDCHDHGGVMSASNCCEVIARINVDVSNIGNAV
jgi:hypothetical protein